MQIDKSLRLVLERRNDDGKYYVYSSTVSRNMAKEYWEAIKNAIGRLYAGSDPRMAPKFAADAVRAAARDLDMLDAVERFFIPEIRRLTTVIKMGAAGWEQIPFDEAVKTGLVDEDEADEIEGAIVFFTLAWRFHPTSDRAKVVMAAVLLWAGWTTSLAITDFINSLRTSPETVVSGETTPEAPPASPQAVMDASGSQVPS